MTVLTRTPSNPNLLHPNKFQISCPRLPNIQYFTQSLAVPGIAMSESFFPTPFVDIYPPGEKAIFDILNITFLVDEELTAWLEVYDWIFGMTFPTDFSDYNTLPTQYRNKVGTTKERFPQYSDMSITILTSSNNPIVRFDYKDCYPTSLSNFLISATDDPNNPITSDVSIRYSYFKTTIL